ncbi:hypothetical protein DFS34DRAFT_638997 [Phlyctochytrium arcticum]|nr:hypothetical protein DFS34DRAFT_638997 [Phlyctochytrium arcticum]
MVTSTGSPADIAASNQRIRDLFAHSDPEQILDLLDLPETETTLYCLVPTRALLTFLAQQISDSAEASSRNACINVLSIGSASGLLEYLLQSILVKTASPAPLVYGIDISRTNIFLPPSQFIFLPSEQPDCQELADMAVLMVSYLRRPELLITYLGACPDARVLIVMGPVMEDPMREVDVRTRLEVGGWKEGRGGGRGVFGLKEWEQVRVFRRAGLAEDGT